MKQLLLLSALFIFCCCTPDDEPEPEKQNIEQQNPDNAIKPGINDWNDGGKGESDLEEE